MNYSCEICGYSTKVKQNYEKHCNRKFKCKSHIEVNEANNAVINKVKKKHECIYCKKIYSTNSHMRRHEKSCKVKLENEQIGKYTTIAKKYMPIRLRETQGEYVYLIQEREFIRLNENVFKIGKSIQKNCNRVDSYPRFSKIILILEVNNCAELEKKIIAEFGIVFDITDYGKEYFQGDMNEIKIKMLDMVNDYIAETG